MARNDDPWQLDLFVAFIGGVPLRDAREVMLELLKMMGERK
jgi:hypothetical protein